MSGLRSVLFPRALALVSLALIVLVRPAAAEPDLSADGAVLPPVVLGNVAAGIVDQTIVLGADVPTSTHVVVQFSGSPPLMRDAGGLFQPWDRDVASLADNGFVPVGDNLEFKVLNQDLSGNNFPMRVTVYYRANGVLKYGHFDVFRRN